MKTISPKCKTYYCTWTAPLPVGVFYADINGHYLAVNDRWCEIAGATVAEAEGDNWVQTLHPGDKKYVFAQWYRAVQESLPFQSEYRFQHPDGKITWVLGQALAQRDNSGAVIGYVGTITDISDRKQTEEELRKDCHNLEALLQERTAELRRVDEQLQQEIAQRKRLEETQTHLVATLEATTDIVGTQFREISADISTGQNITKIKQAEEELALRNRELLTLHRISEIHLSTQSLKATLQEIVEEISTATGFPIVAIELYDESRQMMVFEAMKGVPLPQNSNVLEVPADQTLSGTVARTGEPVIKVYAPQESKKCDSNETLKVLGIKTFICMPMTVNGRVLGTLSLAHPEVVQLDARLPQWIASLANYVASLTERKQAEETLKQQKELLQTIFDHIPAMVAFFDAAGQIKLVNRAWESILGWSIEEIQSCDLVAEFYPDPESRQFVLDYILAADGQWGDFKTRVRDGRILDTSWANVRLSDGSSIGIGQDITERKQMEEALRQQFLKEQLMVVIGQRIRQSLNLEEILNTTVEEVRQFLQVDRVLIYRVWPNGTGSAVTEAVVPDWPAILGRTFPEEVFPQESHELYGKGRILAISNVEQAETLPCLVEFVQQFGVKAKLVVPILQEEALWGLLIAHHCSEPRQWQQFEIDLLRSLATQVSIAIHQSELYKQTQHQALREQGLNRVIQSIRNSLDLTTIFSTAAHEVAKLLQSDRAEILQYIPERKLWLNVADYCQNPDLPSALGLEIPDEGNEIAARLKRLEIVRISDSNTCEDQINQGYAKSFPGAWLLVPLHYGSKLWGSLSLVKNKLPYLWQDSEVELACVVANQLAIALQQAELYQQSRTATTTAVTQAQQIEQALSELQRTQSQLVQSEKMSSLGQLVAGVAHEINNPVTFIYANLIHAENYTQDILGLLQLYQQQYPAPTPAISSEIEAIDLDFLIEDLPKLLDSMKIGAERICEIVAALRNFSRLAEAEIKAVDIHQGLDSTLTILQNRLKAQGKHPEIQVIKEYGNLPKVECYAGQLNQVFMNLLSNAIDALAELNVESSNQPSNLQPSTPSIRISTEVLNDQQITIRIADNGPGMTEPVKARIFDPFFTTKPVGTGTGLGLSISYQIVVKKHGGQLHCFSQLGQGTEFVIQIPVRQRPLS